MDFKTDTTSQIPADSAIVTIADAQALVSVYDVTANAFNGGFQNIPGNVNSLADPLGLNGEYAQIYRWTSSFFNGYSVDNTVMRISQFIVQIRF